MHHLSILEVLGLVTHWVRGTVEEQEHISLLLVKPTAGPGQKKDSESACTPGLPLSFKYAYGG